MICYPNAKINLGLNVTGCRPDGYHNLETVFYPIPVCDVLQVETARTDGSIPPCDIFPPGSPARTDATPDCTLRTAGIGIDCPAEQNLVVKALHQLKQDFNLPYLYIYMYKQIPSGAGLGGGSADAAFMMKALNSIFRLGLDNEGLEARVSALGADCAFFVRNRPVSATGIGNLFSPVSLSLDGWHLVLVKPDIFISTKEAYAHITPRQPDISPGEVLRRPVEEWRDTLVNDFEAGVFSLYPEIAAIKTRLYDCGAAYASMSGSGSSVFGLFRHEPDETALCRFFPGCFYRQAVL